MIEGNRNPAKLPPDLTPAEKHFAYCLAKGDFCTIESGKFPNDANVIRGEVIRFFAYGGNEKNPVLGPIIYLRGAQISTSLDLAHASIPYVLCFIHCDFVAPVLIQRTACDSLYLRGSRLMHGLHADGLTTKGSVNLRDVVSVKGGVRLLGANIGMGLDCEGGKFHNPGGDALSADGLTTKGTVNLNERFSAEGTVRLLGANIGGDLDCADGNFHNPNGYVLIADRLKVQGSVYLRGSFSAKGEVRLLGARVDGNLDCTGGEFHNPSNYALAADKLVIKGSVNLSEGFSAEGEVRLLGANINGDVDCEYGKFHNPGGYALNIQRSNISGCLLWQKINYKGSVNLAYAKAEVLADASDSWETGKFILDGFTYNQFANRRNIKSHLRWLANRPSHMEFSPLPYEQAAKVLFGMGYVREAREILLAKERLLTRDKHMPVLRKFGRWLWDMFAGYGYRLRYTAMWILGFIFLGSIFFDFAARHNQIVPHHPAIVASAKYQAILACKKHTPMEAVRVAFPNEYPEFTPLAFSLDVFMPFFALHQEPSWAPASDKVDDLRKSSIFLMLLMVASINFVWLAWIFQNLIRREQGGDSGPMWAGIGMASLVFMLSVMSTAGVAHILWDFEIVWLIDWRWLTVWYWIEIAAGWMLSSLFLLSITSILRPRQSPGAKD